MDRQKRSYQTKPGFGFGYCYRSMNQTKPNYSTAVIACGKLSLDSTNQKYGAEKKKYKYFKSAHSKKVEDTKAGFVFWILWLF